MYQAICCSEGTGIHSTALGSGAASKNSSGKASARVGTFPREQSRKRQVLGLPKTPKTEVVGHSSLSERHGSTNGHGTAQEARRLNGGTVSVLFLLHYDTQRVAATPQVLRVSRIEDTKCLHPTCRGHVSKAKEAALL